jgi:CRP/FNR family transcriptional regulator, cyclic AMP receptor protein
MAIERSATAEASRVGVGVGKASRTMPLLDLDPELGAGLTPERLAMARNALQVRIVRLPRGEWAGETLRSIGHSNVGLLVIHGVVAREVVLDDTVSTELLGPGDLLRPWATDDESQLLAHGVRWQVLAEARLAMLGQAFGRSLGRYPEITAALLDRACARAQRLATTQAICQLNSVDRRLLALFWHLAERWGRVTADGVVVPLTLSHRLLGELVGARRPTVTTALAALDRQGKVRRRADATWLLSGEPPGRPTKRLRRVVSHRRRLLHDDPEPGLVHVDEEHDELR